MNALEKTHLGVEATKKKISPFSNKPAVCHTEQWLKKSKLSLWQLVDPVTQQPMGNEYWYEVVDIKSGTHYRIRKTKTD